MNTMRVFALAVVVCVLAQHAHAQSFAITTPLARSIAVQRYLGRHNRLPEVTSIGTLRSFDYYDDTGSGFQKFPTQFSDLRFQIVDLGVETLWLELHYIPELGVENSADRYRVCHSLADTVSLNAEEFCSGATRDPCDSNVVDRITTAEDCAEQNVFDYGPVDTGCSPTSPTLLDVLRDIVDAADDAVSRDRNRFFRIIFDDYSANAEGPQDNGQLFEQILRDSGLYDRLYRPDLSADYTQSINWPTLTELTEIEDSHFIYFSNNPSNTGVNGFPTSYLNVQYNNLQTFRSTNNCFGVDQDVPTFFTYASGESVIYQYDNDFAFCELDDPSDNGVNFMSSNDINALTNCGFSALPTLVTEDTIQAAMWAFDVGQPKLAGGRKENRCVYLSADTGKLYTDACFEKKFYMCKNGEFPYEWKLSEKEIDPSEEITLCPDGYHYGEPTTPQELNAAHAELILAAESVAWVNIQYHNGCWFARGETGRVCTALFDPEFDDDDLSGGAIAGIVIGSVVGALLLLLLLFLLIGGKGEQVFTGSGPAKARDNPDG